MIQENNISTSCSRLSFFLFGILILLWSTDATHAQIDYSNVKVYGVSAYEADYINGLPESSPSGQIKVDIGKMTTPVVLVFSGYDPMTWKVSNPYNAEIKLVILNGWNQQTVTGIDTSVTVISQNRIRHYFPDLDTSQYSDYTYLENYVKGITGKGFTTFQNAYDGMYFFIREPNSVPFELCDVYKFYCYQGKGATPTYQYTPRGSVEVEIGAVSGPIILVLSAYNPVKWNIRNPGNVTIKEVLVAGYYQGSVTGIDDSVTIVSTHEYESGELGRIVGMFVGQPIISSQSTQTGSYFLVKNPTGIRETSHPLIETDQHLRFTNPFNSTTTITYHLLSEQKVHLVLYNVTGQLIQTIVNTIKKPGKYQDSWNINNQKNGMYFLKANIGKRRHTHKIILQK